MSPFVLTNVLARDARVLIVTRLRRTGLLMNAGKLPSANYRW